MHLANATPGCGPIPFRDPILPRNQIHRLAMMSLSLTTHKHKCIMQNHQHQYHCPIPRTDSVVTQGKFGQTQNTQPETASVPLTPERNHRQGPRDAGQGWSQQLYKHGHVDICAISTAPTMSSRRIPNTAHEEPTQVITGILFTHARAHDDEARRLEYSLFAYPKILRFAPNGRGNHYNMSVHGIHG